MTMHGGGGTALSESIDIAALQSGDRGALDAFYRAYARTVLDWVRRLGGPYIDSEDVAHDAFAVAFRRLHTYRPEVSSVQAWLFGVTRRVVANARRRSALRRFVGLDKIAEPPHPGPDTEEEVARLWRRRQIQLALEQLKEPHREALVLMDLEERTAPEVAEMLGISVGTVYSRVHYGRKAFAVELQRILGPDAHVWNARLGEEGAV